MTREILVHIDQGRDPITNLRRETELFEEVDRGEVPESLRFWVNSQCLVRGRAKSAKYGWYDEAKASEMKVPIIERPTGGGVVYHDEGNLNWSFFLRTRGAFLSPTVAFGQASRYVIAALDDLGLKATFSPPNRIDVSGRKVSGMAAKSTVRTILVHGTLLLDADLDRLNLLCIPPSGCPPVSNIKEWLKDVNAETIVTAVLAVLRNSGFQIRMADGSTSQ